MNVRSKLGLAVSILLFMMGLFPAVVGAAGGDSGKGSKVIGQVLASSITVSGAEISAIVDKGYTSKLYIGTDPGNLDLVMGYTSQSGSQYWFQVTGLKPGTTYYYQLEAASGKKIEKSSVLSFTTLSDPLIISGVQSYSTGTTFTKFEWITNHNATSALYFGVDPLMLDQTAITVEDGGTLHLAYADQLTPGTTYYYQVVAKDGYGNYVKSDVYKFTTLSPSEQLIISGVQAYSTGATFTKFEWSTNHNAASALYFGVDPLNLDQTAIAVQDGGTLHLAYADQLTPGTTYYYQVVAKDGYGNYVKSDVYKFTTLSETKQ
jgi:hypothetical protein